MVQLRDDIDKFNSLDIQIVGVSYDSVEILKKLSEKENIPFQLLSDEGSKVIEAYGLHFRDGLPHPGTLLLDRSGVIRAKLFHEGYRTRHTNEELILAAQELR